METIIATIISEIPINSYFDTHTVISRIMEEYHDEYLKGFQGFSSTELYHASIGKLISKLENTRVEKVGDGYSKNVKGLYSSVTCWKRLS